MTQPAASPYGDADANNDNDAADALSRLIAGNDHLISNPHLVQAMYNANASPAQASAINQFVGGMNLAGQVQVARAAGTKVNITSDQQNLLNAMGTKFSDVQYTQADQQAAIDAEQLKLKTVADEQNAAQASGGGGWKLSSLWHNPVVNELSKLPNQIAGVGNLARTAIEQTDQALGGHPYSDAEIAAAKAQGYDLTSPISALAYESSGKRPINADNLYAGGADPSDVAEAFQYINHPDQFLDGLVNTPNQTQAETDALFDKYVNPKTNQAFKKLVAQVQADMPSPGNLVTYNMDPESTAKKYISGATDAAYFFLADPTAVVANGVFSAVKLSAIGVKTLDDSQKVVDVLNGTKKGYNAYTVRAGMQSFIDNTTALRVANAAGDREGIAAATARIQKLNPGLLHLTDEFVNGARSVDLSGKAFVAGKPIENLGEAAVYFASKNGMLRLMSGKPPLEGQLIPGALSPFGFKTIAASLRWGKVGQAARKVGTAFGLTTDLKPISEADRVLNLNKPGVADRVLPTDPDTAVDAATGKPISGVATDDAVVDDHLLQSQARGQAEFNSRTSTATGNRLVDTTLGIINPFKIVPRVRLVAQRITTTLPTSFIDDTSNPNSAQQILKIAKTVLNSADANLITGRFMAADEGARKVIMQGLELQRLHAAGMGYTEGGRELLRLAAEPLTTQAYSAVHGLDRMTDPLTGEDMGSAVWDTQVRTAFKFTDFRTQQKMAAKIGLWESTIGRMFQPQIVDESMGLVRTGWILTGTNLVRNAGEEMLLSALKGQFLERLKAKAALQAAGVLPARTRLGNMIAAPLVRSGLAARYQGLLVDAEDDFSKYILQLGEYHSDQMGQWADDWAKFMNADKIDPQGVGDATAIGAAGYRPVSAKMHRTGYGEVSVDDDMVGAQRMSDHLGMIVNANPEHARTVINYLMDQDATPLQKIIDSFNAPENVKKVQQMRFANFYEGPDGAAHQAITPAERAMALRQLAEKQATEMRYLLQNRDGSAYNEDLVGHILDTGKGPSPDWIMKNMTGEARPQTVLAPQFEAMPVDNQLTSLVGALHDVTGRGYQMMVGRPMTRLSTMPTFALHYAKSRIFLKPGEEEMKAAGDLADSTIENMLHNTAMDMAMNRMVGQIDDPTLRTQMDIVGRNFFAFSRATTGFVRRWGQAFVENPARLRRVQLALEAGNKSGLIWTDENGQQQFSFPASGVAIDALMRVAEAIPGMPTLRVPGAIPNLTGKVALLQSGLQNPLQMGLTPMANYPLRFAEKMFPQHREAIDQLDSFFNGSQGQGQGLWAQVEPTAVKKFTDALVGDDKDSLIADSTRAAMLNLDAGGHTPPANADGPTVDAWIQNTRTQVKNVLLMRAIAGFFTPAPPGTPTWDNEASRQDWAYGALGIRSLGSEYKEILNEANGDYGRANQVWAALHPDQLAYEQGTTTAQEKNSVFAATAETQSWLQKNVGFMDKYGGADGVSAYFVPADTQQGQFSIQAYNAELEMGLRQHKDLKDYYADIRTANAAADYYTLTAQRDAAIAANPDAKTAINATFTSENALFNSMNPLWADSQTNYADRVQVAQNQLDTLRNMVQAKNLPVNVPVDDLKFMLQTYDQYHDAVKANPGSSDVATGTRSQFRAIYNAEMTARVSGNATLKGIYQGVFRTLDSDALDNLGST